MQVYDLIIIGCGGTGSATLYNATHAGLDTLCLEQYERGHKRGGTHGETRAFRKAYYDNPYYIPLLKKAYLDWKRLNEKAGDLFIENGILEIGSANSQMVLDAIKCAENYKIPIEILSSNQIAARYPLFNIHKNMVGIFQPEAGFLRVDDCVNYFVNSSASNGATIAYNEKVIAWSVSANNLVQVQTDKTTYKSRYLIITTGSWAQELLEPLDIPLKIIQKKLIWVPVVNDAYSVENGTPCFAYHINNQIFYGFPNINGCIKVASHNGGLLLNHPDEISDDLDNKNGEVEAIQQFVSQYLSKVSLKNIKQANCLYDITPDKQFIIDNHPNYPQIAFAAGLSGHAYKMSNVLGNILIDLVIKQSTEFDISFLSLNRL